MDQINLTAGHYTVAASKGSEGVSVNVGEPQGTMRSGLTFTLDHDEAVKLANWILAPYERAR